MPNFKRIFFFAALSIFSREAFANVGYQCGSYDLTSKSKGYIALGWDENASANASLANCARHSPRPKSCAFSKCELKQGVENYLRTSTTIRETIVDLHLNSTATAARERKVAVKRVPRRVQKGKSAEEVAGEAIAAANRQTTCLAIQKAIGGIDVASCYGY